MNENKTEHENVDAAVEKTETTSWWKKIIEDIHIEHLIIIFFVSCLIPHIIYSPMTVNLSAYLGKKFLEKNKTDAAVKCLKFAHYIGGSEIKNYNQKHAYLEYELAKLNRDNYEEYMKMMDLSASHGSGKAAYDLAEYFFKTDRHLKGIYYLQMAAAAGIEDAQYELAVYYLVNGSYKEKVDAEEILADIAGRNAQESAAKISSSGAAATTFKEAFELQYKHSLFNDIESGKAKWQAVSKDPLRKCTFLGEYFEKPSDQCALGLKFLETHIRLNYPRYEAEKILKDFANSVKADSEVNYDLLKTNTYAGMLSQVKVSGTDYYFKDFNVDMLTSRNANFKEWGIFWLKKSASNGCKTAERLLKNWEKGENKNIESPYESSRVTYQLTTGVFLERERNFRKIKKNK